MKSILKTTTKGKEWNRVYTAVEHEQIVHIRVNNSDKKSQKVSIAIDTTTPGDGEIATATIGGIPFAARLLGAEGNEISVEIIDPGAAGDLSVSVVDKAITVTLASDGSSITSTIGDVVSAIQDNDDADKLVYIDTTEISSLTDIATAASKTNLSGGITDYTFYILKDYRLSANDYIDFSTKIAIPKGHSLFIKADLPMLNFSIALDS